ncbi:hypothetical protein PR202_ga21295 [Eleusine coracana subsp. coracana]|uniref:Fe2OG dioxygenase domain-containing protein n=1 Tax=Eleusine coracana subsp. coracana TaxID=191504 RepID=A0AAV5D0M1_ELECO|nr:hypothetical protein QOZ80_8AG0634700 [Eleusine coracana subsp. coracana]GJN03814.1 hypothetical protein PR202_ga21295 [Eleusine coracana subsp. coracana]
MVIMATASPAPHSPPKHTNGEHNCHPSVLSTGGNDDGGGIPVVDFDVLVNGTADERSQAVRDLGRACEDWGFFMVSNHGVPEDLKEAMLEACKELFSLPDEEKAEHLETEPMAPIRIGSGFYSVVDGARYWRNYLKMFAHPELHCPEKPAKLRDVAAEYSAKTRDLLLQLAKAISGSLGLDGGRISEALNFDACFQILVGNHYPAYTGPGDLGVGLPAHSDHGLLTLLFQDGSVDGLQVEHDGEWHLAKPLPGAFFVIAGDQLEIVSNGRYKAAVHRAVVGGEQERMSFVSMISPSMDTVVEPVPELALEGRGMEFRGVRYRDYMAYQQSNKLEAKEALNIARVRHTTDRVEQVD